MAHITHDHVTESWRSGEALRVAVEAAATVLRRWRQRARGRAQLARMNRRQLQDIGLTPGGALFEASKPFWRD